jgi:ABC-2 type transport system ATP-binding protein
MEEAQLLADRVAVIAGGRIVAEGSPRTLGGRQQGVTTIRFGLPEGTQLPDRFAAEQNDGRYLLETDEPTRLLHELTDWALSARASLEGLEVTQPSLEDVYLRLTAQEGEEAA